MTKKTVHTEQIKANTWRVIVNLFHDE